MIILRFVQKKTEDKSSVLGRTNILIIRLS